MATRRYTIVVQDEDTGAVRRYQLSSRFPLITDTSDLLVAFTVTPKRALVLLALIVVGPLLMGLGARSSAQAELQAMRANSALLEVENSSYRAATRELTGQISSLQQAITDLGQRANIDPATTEAIAKLPSVIKARATGGGVETVALKSALSPALASPEDTFGILRDLLGRLESRLQLVRTDLEKRSALAAATPSIWPAHGWLSATFGEREDPFTGGEQFHTGLDISCDKGSPVYAAADGTVESASYNGAYGNLLVIKHGFGLVTRYGHLSSFAVPVGEKVTRGQVVAYVGATGRATGPHLHYEVLVNGTPMNPLKVLTEPRP